MNTDIQEQAGRASSLDAARIAYANEFPLNADGEPDVGNIHANIRALKAERDQLRAALQRVVSDPVAHRARSIAKTLLEELAQKYPTPEPV